MTDSRRDPFVPGPPAIAVATRPTDPPIVRPLAPPEARRLLLVAGAVGLLGQLLFVAQGAGINVPIWTAAVLVAAALARSRETAFDRLDAWLPVAALLFAGSVAVRADPDLVAFDLVAAFGLTSASIAAMAGIPVTRRSLGGTLRTGVRGTALALGGAWRLRSSFDGVGRAGRSPAAATSVRVLLGLALALPIVLVFVALFSAADAVFAELIVDLVTVPLDLGEVPGRLTIAVALAWVVGGLLVMTRASTDVMRRDDPLAPPVRVGGIEATVVLVAVDAVFLLFVALQAAYLFGGRDTLAETGLTYSEYARRGFFELVAVAVLAGGLLVGLEGTVRDRGRAYRAAALLLLGATGVVLLSALYRLALYQTAYGWTELRFYVLLAIAWLGLCLVAAAATIITARSRWLPHAIVILGLLIALAANLIGPQAFVASQNVARAIDPGAVPTGGWSGLDTDYLSSLGDEAVPVLLDSLDRLPPDDRATVVRALAERRRELTAPWAPRGWPSLNLAREVARSRLEAANLP